MANKRKKDPFKIVLIITVILGILGAGCIVGSNWIRQQRAERLQVLTDQVITENAESQAAYEQALEESVKKCLTLLLEE